jgi:effector-binding domain-containing protein
MEEESGLIGMLRRHWQALAAVALLLAAVGVVAQRRLSSGGDAAKQAATAPASPEAAKSDAAKPDAAKPEAAAPATPDASAAVASETVMVDARPVAMLKGQGKWEGAAKTLSEAIAKLNAAVAKAGLAVNGRTIAVFTKTDDTGFTFEAMAPLSAAPEGKVKLSDGVEIGASPAGKAMKFQHRGAYDEIDATYEAIAAYLDEKGLDTKDLIIEEYLGDFKGDDAEVNVDIYVFLK